ncbi:MAG: universal stress protein [Rhodospirillales bacterium]|nr:universal stress protein [Rhodospirillales bacterium]
MFKHILIPTDGSPLSRKAIVVGVKLAKSFGARVTGVFAAPPATPLVYGDHLPVGYAAPEEHEKMIRDSAARYLGVIERAAKKAGVRCQAVRMTSDYPADVILAVAKKEKCDLVVMASHGRRGLRGVLLGSETQKVLTHSKIPVLVCR